MEVIPAIKPLNFVKATISLLDLGISFLEALSLCTNGQFYPRYAGETRSYL